MKSRKNGHLNQPFGLTCRPQKKQALIPQLEEDITDMRWIGAEDNEWRENTFPSIVDVIDA